jgi:hypothetical protein
MRRTLALGVVALSLAACGPRAVQATGPTMPTIATAGGARRVLVLTDLEEVRDVASSTTAPYVATDDGVLVYEGESGSTPRRVGRAEGLPDDDVIAVAVEPDGAVLAATAAGLAQIRGSEVTVVGTPAHARPTDLEILADGTAWLCTLSGLVRRSAGTWARFGDPVACTTLAPTPEGGVWAGTTQGALYVEGDVVREHPVSGGIPEPYVRSIIPVLPGQILALVNGPQRSQLAFWDGTSWYGYTLPGLEEPVVGLVMRGGADATLVTRDRAFSIVPNGAGTPFRPLSSSVGNVRSFRAATSTDTPPPAEVDAGSGSPTERGDAAATLRGPQRLAEEPTGPSPSVRAPALVAQPLGIALPPGMYRGIQEGAHGWVAVGNRGVAELPRRGDLRALRSRSLVPEDDLQVATETQGGVWMRARGGHLAKWVEGRLRRVSFPDDIVPQAIATGPRGAYLAAIVRGTRNVRIFTNESGSWGPLVEREMEVAVASIPFMGIAPDGKIWMGIRIDRPEGGSRVRGAARIDPAADSVAYFHRAAAQGIGLPVPDEISAMTFDAQGNAWFATLNGAVRVEEHQAIVFDETRGVRGEVVTDVATGSGRMWIAAAEGLGSYADRQFDFTQPPIVSQHRPIALASDAAGHLWAVGANGLLQHDGTDWRHLGSADGLPTDALTDVEVDNAGRVWLLTADAVVVLLEPQRAASRGR